MVARVENSVGEGGGRPADIVEDRGPAQLLIGGGRGFDWGVLQKLEQLMQKWVVIRTCRLILIIYFMASIPIFLPILRVHNARTGALEYENQLPYTWVPGSHPTIVQYGSDTYVVVTVTTEMNGSGTQDAGDHQVTSIFRTGHAPGALPWPMFSQQPEAHRHFRRLGAPNDLGNVDPTRPGDREAPCLGGGGG